MWQALHNTLIDPDIPSASKREVVWRSQEDIASEPCLIQQGANLSIPRIDAVDLSSTIFRCRLVKPSKEVTDVSVSPLGPKELGMSPITPQLLYVLFLPTPQLGCRGI